MSTQTSPLDLGVLPISKLLKQYAFPAIIAMTASSLYNMVDSIFIGHGVGSRAISGLALTFPFMNLSAAFGAMIGVGSSTLISVRLGQQDYKAAQHIFGNAIILTLILGSLFSILTQTYLNPILYFFGASPATLPYAREYMTVILSGNLVTRFYLTFNAILRSTGHPPLSMNATILAVIFNTILNPLFIYGLHMGIRGSATATVIAQVISLIWQINVFRDSKELIHFKKGIYALKKKIIKDTLSIGLSPFLMNSCACFFVILINRGLGHYGSDLAIGAYGIVTRMLFIFVMVVIGLNQGMQPIAGYNYGAQNYARVLKVLRYTLLWGTIATTIGFLIGELYPELCVRAFTTDSELINISVRGMRTVFIFYPLIGMYMVTTNFFQSIGKAYISIFLSLTRQLIFLIPLLIILPRFLGVKGVWISMPIADIIACTVSGLMLISKYRKIKMLTK
ncbi:MAG: MATE family efflux transporter [Paraprevotella sp.]|nr:MATE family efflux transporter [Paraprevotella sp.]